MIEFAYRHIDWFIIREINNYLDLNTIQKRQLKQQLGIQIKEHRHTILPRYIHFLDQLSIDMENGLSHREIQDTVDHFKALYGITAHMMIDLTASLMTQLSEEQIQYLATQIEKANREQQESYKLNSDVQSHYNERIKRNIKRMKYWADSVSHTQKEMISRETLAFPDTYRLWHNYNLSKQKEMLKLLQTKPDVNQMNLFLTDWWINSKGKSTELETLSQRESEIFIDYVKVIDDSFDKKQRQHAIKRLQYFSSAFKNLRIDNSN